MENVAEACKKMYELIEDRAPYAVANAKAKELVRSLDSIKIRTSKRWQSRRCRSGWWCTASVWKD